jgi:hypothetical protein
MTRRIPRSDRRSARRAWILAPLLLFVFRFAARADDPVAVPGGPDSYRRLLGLDLGRTDADFFLQLHEALCFGAQEDAPWSRIESRRRAVQFVEDLAEWRRLFGEPARFSSASENERIRGERALDWLGFRVIRQGGTFSAQRLADEKSLRRQSFLHVLGSSTAAFVSRLKAGGEVSVAVADTAVPLPFGLAAWRETLSERDLAADNAFLFFVQNPRASRMLVALHALDPGTRDDLRAVSRGADGRGNGWKVLYERSLDAFCRSPGAVDLSGGRFLLPGGTPADPIWTDLFGGAPPRGAEFLPVLYGKDDGKAAYVVDSLHSLRQDDARDFLLPAGLSESDARGRFRKIYASIDVSGENFRRSRRDPYDFPHVVPLLESAEGGIAVAAMASKPAAKFPRDETGLAAEASAPRDPASAEEAVRRILGGPPASRRFVFLVNLLARRPALAEPGLAALLASGSDRFLPAYSLFDDLPSISPAAARRYLFALDRLERRGSSRDAEVSAGLFEGSVALLGLVSRAGGLAPAQLERLLEALLDLPLFARSDLAAGEGERDLFGWLFQGLLPAIQERQLGETGHRGMAAAESAPAHADVRDPDELLARATAGPPAPSPVEWRGGRYRYDPAEEELARRRLFRERQRLTWLSDLESLHRTRDEVLAAAGRGDVDAVRSQAAELAHRLGVSASGGSFPEDPDERVQVERERARDGVDEIAAMRSAVELRDVPKRLAATSALVAERHLEALFGHLYAAAARDPDDLYYQDPAFVRRHSLRALEIQGSDRVRGPFAPAALLREPGGGGSRVSGSVFGLTAVLGLLHTDQLAYGSGVIAPNEEVRAGLVTPIWEMSVSRLDDDALEFVSASVRSARELARTLSARAPAERLAVWERLAEDLVPRSRLAGLAALEEPGEEAISRWLSPSDLYRIGIRLAASPPDPGLPTSEEASRARGAIDRLRSRLGEAGTRERLAEFGPRPAAYAGQYRLSDRDLPPYERLASYRRPEMFGERLYDVKIAVAVRVADERLPAAVLPIVLPAALDELLVRLRMAYAYDWGAVVAAASAFSREDLARILDEAVDAGRLVREENAESDTGGGS